MAERLPFAEYERARPSPMERRLLNRMRRHDITRRERLYIALRLLDHLTHAAIADYLGVPSRVVDEVHESLVSRGHREEREARRLRRIAAVGHQHETSRQRADRQRRGRA